MKKLKSFLTFLFVSLLTNSVTNAQNTWEDYTPTYPGSIAISPNDDIFIGYGGAYSLLMENPGAGVFRSTNNGSSWQLINLGLTSTHIVGLHCTSNGILIAGTHFDKVFRSTDNGSTWSQVPVTARLSWFTSKGDTIFGSDGFWCRGVFRSTNGGASWTAVNTGLVTCVNGITISSSGNIFAATGTSGVYRSTDWGESWIPTNSGITSLNCSPIVSTVSGSIFVGTHGDGIFRSTNEGQTWTRSNSGLPGLFVTYLASNSVGHIFAGIFPGGIYRSTNNGISWHQLNSNVIDTLRSVNSIAFTSTGYVWISVSGRIYRSISPLVSVSRPTSDLPTSFWLGQNYPNPFNPYTIVEFALPSPSSVSLKIFNILGQEVATVLEDHLEPGIYKVQWNAQPFASGIYFYRLTAGLYSETKKLILQK
jgi:photosystem II stability/assembly factor-like uncharacterized protein